MSTDYEVIIVGAGIMGCALGYALGTDGRKVLVLERDINEPDRIVGELLQPGGVQKLRELGMEDCLENIDAPECVGYGVFLSGRGTKLPYPKDANGNTLVGRSFHHGKFIMNLRNAVKRAKGAELRQGTVTTLLQEGAQVCGVTYKDSSNTVHEVRAPLTIVCDGCFSNFRKNFFQNKPESTTCFVGVVIKDTPLPFPQHGHVFLTTPGPILAYQLDTNETRMLVDVPQPLPSSSNGDLQRYLIDVTAPQLPESIRSAFVRAVTETKPRSMPNNRLHPQSCNKPGVLLLGDAFNMRHPLTGGGMTVAFSDAVVIRNILRTLGSLNNTNEVTKSLGEFYIKRKPLAATINILAGALYKVFTAADNPVLPQMRHACMSYFRMGGMGVSGPVSLLSGLNPNPLSLAFHFFAVAFLGVAQCLYPFPTPGRILKAYRLLSAASTIVVPLIRAENVLPFIPVLCNILLLTRNKPNANSITLPDEPTEQ